jgi:hypothetical protein
MPRASSFDLDAAAILFVILGVARDLSDIIRRKADLQPRRRFSKLSHPSSFWTSAVRRSSKHLTSYMLAALAQAPIIAIMEGRPQSTIKSQQ